MIYLSFFIYLITWPFAYFFLLPILDVQPSQLFLYAIGWLAISGIFIFVVVKYFVPVYARKHITFFKAITSAKTMETKVFSVFVILSIGIVAYVLYQYNKINFFVFSILVPAFCVSLATLLCKEQQVFEDTPFPSYNRPKRSTEQLTGEALSIFRQDKRVIPLPDGDIFKEWNWEYRGMVYSLNLYIRRSSMAKIESINTIHSKDISRWTDIYIANGVTSELRDLADRLYSQCGAYEPMKVQIGHMQGFIENNFSYKAQDNVNDIAPQYPLKTLVMGSGTKTDFFILYALLLKLIGFRTVLMTNSHTELNSLAIGINLPNDFLDDEKAETIKYNDIYYYIYSLSDEKPSFIGNANFGEDKVRVFPVAELRKDLVLPAEHNVSEQ